MFLSIVSFLSWLGTIFIFALCSSTHFENVDLLITLILAVIFSLVTNKLVSMEDHLKKCEDEINKLKKQLVTLKQDNTTPPPPGIVYN